MPAAYRANIRYLALQHRHRPRAAVLVWANELADLLGSPELNDLPRLGGINGPYVVRYDAGAMLSAEAAGADLLARLSDATRRPAPLAVHWSDALRLAILWRFGGAYVDVGMVPMRRLYTPEYQNSFAINDHTYRCVEPFQLPVTIEGIIRRSGKDDAKPSTMGPHSRVLRASCVVFYLVV